MNNRQVAHAWASQTKDSAKGSNFFFAGKSIFSYGAHFEIACFVPGKEIDGRAVVLFTSRDYSVSTQRHKSYARNAIAGRHVFVVPEVKAAEYPEYHGKNLASFLSDAKSAHEMARKALTHGKLYGAQEAAAIANGAAYATLFARQIPKTDVTAGILKELRALDKKRRAGKLWTAEELAQFDARELRAKAAADKRDERRTAARREYEARWAKENAEKIEEARVTLDAWARGETDTLPGYSYEAHLPTKIRIKGDDIETSRGAKVTTARAVELWRLLNAGTGDAAPVLGFDVDGFRVSSWDGEKLTIGCHVLERPELARLAAVLGV